MLLIKEQIATSLTLLFISSTIKKSKLRLQPSILILLLFLIFNLYLKAYNFINRNKNSLYFAIASHVTLQNAKNFLVSKLSEIQSIGHFLRTPNGYKVTAPEGFVAVDRAAGAVKLVDRLEFSRANFTAEKDWVKG